MKIGLIRHFRVKLLIPPVATAAEVAQWLASYDESPVVIPDELPDTAGFEICWSSDLPRARKTASLVFRGEISENPLLREIPLAPYKRDDYLRPVWYWLIRARLAWEAGSFTQPENRLAVAERARAVLDQVEASGKQNVLLVTHGLFMLSLQKELRRRGYAGKQIFRPRNGKLCLFSKP